MKKIYFLVLSCIAASFETVNASASNPATSAPSGATTNAFYHCPYCTGKYLTNVHDINNACAQKPEGAKLQTSLEQARKAHERFLQAAQQETGVVFFHKTTGKHYNSKEVQAVLGLLALNRDYLH